MWAPSAVPALRRVVSGRPLPKPGVHLSLCTGLSVGDGEVGWMEPRETIRLHPNAAHDDRHHRAVSPLQHAASVSGVTTRVSSRTADQLSAPLSSACVSRGNSSSAGGRKSRLDESFGLAQFSVGALGALGSSAPRLEPHVHATPRKDRVGRAHSIRRSGAASTCWPLATSSGSIWARSPTSTTTRRLGSRRCASWNAAVWSTP